MVRQTKISEKKFCVDVRIRNTAAIKKEQLNDFRVKVHHKKIIVLNVYTHHAQSLTLHERN